MYRVCWELKNNDVTHVQLTWYLLNDVIDVHIYNKHITNMNNRADILVQSNLYENTGPVHYYVTTSDGWLHYDLRVQCAKTKYYG